MKEAQKFTKKPVTISAIRWTGDNLAYVICFTDGRMPLTGGNHAAMKWEEYETLVERSGLKIFTLEGKMNADIGDWIIQGVRGEFYPCKPEIFEMTYGPAVPTAKAGSITDCIMNLVDRLGHEAGTVDPRAWQHLLVYAPKLTPPEGWDEAVRIAHTTTALVGFGRSSLAQAILDMDAFFKQQTKQPDD
jgi:hypothetical protein